MEDASTDLASHEVAALAGRHNTTEDNVRKLIVDSRSRSRRDIEEALDLARSVLAHYRAF
jgi:hypothetical protein